jgi:uncharacterized protein YraI
MRQRSPNWPSAALAAAGMVAVTLVMAPGLACAWTAETTEPLNLRQGPALRYPVLLTMPAGASVAVGNCSDGWCSLTFRGNAGYASEAGLSGQAAGAPQAVYVPILPDYPYRGGYYPTADSYFEYPPYAEEKPNFYRWRFFLSPREHDRYRYMPHIFTAGDAAADYGE